MERKAIVTMPPYADFMEEVLKQEIVEGIRLNTVMPVKGALEDKLKGMNDKVLKYGKKFWIDLKARQLRVKSFSSPPFTEIEISHEIDVLTPTKAYFHERDECATISEVNGKKLIMREGPKRVLGPGESITIPHPTLKIKGFLTDDDKNYIEAANKVGLHDYMLSFVESQEDIESLKKLDGVANVIAKIESVNGLNYVGRNWDGKTRLMAARGDLYMEMKWPHEVPLASEMILRKDKEAIVASRILSSFGNSPEPSCADVGDLDNLLRMGYKTFMFGDEICQERDKIISALNVFYLMAERYQGGKK